VLAGQQEGLAFRQVDDAVEHLAGLQFRLLLGLQQAGGVDQGDDVAVALVDLDDVIEGVDVGVEVVADALQLVEALDRLAAEGHQPVIDHLKGLRVAQGDERAAVAHVQVLPVVAQAPALALVGVGRHLLERRQVVDEGGAFLPGELDQPVVNEGQPFGEVLLSDWDAADDLAGLRIDLAQRGLAVLPGALVEGAVMEQQALGVGGRVVGAHVQHLRTQAGRLEALLHRRGAICAAPAQAERCERLQDGAEDLLEQRVALGFRRQHRHHVRAQRVVDAGQGQVHDQRPHLRRLHIHAV